MPGPELTPRQRIERLLEGRPVDRVPFCPAVYSHKAALIGVTPSEMCRDADLFERAIAREVEIYDPDMLVVGSDVYNIEAEAAGCEVLYPASNEAPAVVGRVLEPGGSLDRLRRPNPETDGRMPLHLEVGRRVQERFGAGRIVRGPLAGPFSLATQLVGPEEVLVSMLDRPDWVADLLWIAAGICKSYGRAFAERGLGVIIFDSAASPPMVSPDLYRRLVLPPTAEVVRYFRRDLGLPLVPYIMGGDTAVLLDEILKTGTNNVLCDYTADLDVFVGRLKDAPVLLRANISPALLASASLEAIAAKTRQVLAAGRRHPRFILGTGILPYDIAPERVLAVRKALLENE